MKNEVQSIENTMKNLQKAMPLYRRIQNAQKEVEKKRRVFERQQEKLKKLMEEFSDLATSGGEIKESE